MEKVEHEIEEVILKAEQAVGEAMRTVIVLGEIQAYNATMAKLEGMEPNSQNLALVTWMTSRVVELVKQLGSR